jgi:hypothetical protein
MVKYVNLSIPQPLYERLSNALEGSGYRSPTEYLVYLIRRNVPMLESNDANKRLEALGYL